MAKPRKNPRDAEEAAAQPKRGEPVVLAAARPVAPEDLRVGDGVTVSQATTQLLATDDPPPGDDRHRILTARYIPGDAGQPLRVEAVCLPFVLVSGPDKACRTLDLRRHHLARLDDAYTRRAFRRLGSNNKKKKK
ncbi:MAG: hypothetical protein AAFX76_12800 [Planctomycetota bacterium]